MDRQVKKQISRVPRSERLPVIMLIAAAGGLCGCYGTIAFGTFAFGETGNLLHLWNDLVEGNWINTLLRLLTVGLFVIGIALAVILPEKIGKRKWRVICLIIETVLTGFTMLVPEQVHFLLQLAPLFLAAAMQYHSFNDCEGFAAATIFCSNNLRQTTLGLVGWLRKKDAESLRRFKVYGLVVAAYSCGAIFCCALYPHIGRTVLLPSICIYALLSPCIALEQSTLPEKAEEEISEAAQELLEDAENVLIPQPAVQTVINSAAVSKSPTASTIIND